MWPLPVAATRIQKRSSTHPPGMTPFAPNIAPKAGANRHVHAWSPLRAWELGHREVGGKDQPGEAIRGHVTPRSG